MPENITEREERLARESRAPLMREALVRVLPPATREEGSTEPEESGAVEIAISSESEVERYDWFTGKRYLEILGHATEEIDLSYAKDGLPFFVDHNSRDMVGLVEDIRLDADRVLRGVVRFSQSARAKEIEQDIRDGIRKKISVGYDFPAENYTEKAEGEEVRRRYTGWRPLEASSVPIPADYDVGVGRNARPGVRRPDSLPGVTAAQAKENTVEPTAPPAPAAESAIRANVANEQKEIVATAKKFGVESMVPEFIEKGMDLKAVRDTILEHLRTKSEAVVRAGGEKGPLDLSTKDEKRYSFARAISSALDGTKSYEQEVSEELYRKTGRKRTHPNARLIPTQLLRGMMQTRATMAVASSGAGQQLRFDEYGGFLDILRNRMYVGQFGATFLSGLQGDLSFVTKPSATSLSWGAETAAASSTNFGTGLKTMAPKNGSIVTAYTRQLLAQSVESIEGLVQEDLLKAIALGLDVAAINGSGAANNPAGILATTGIGSVTHGTAGGAAAFGTFVDLWKEVATDNADAAGMKLLTTVGVAGAMQKKETFSGTNGMPVWTWANGLGMVNGHVAAATNQVPSNLTKGSNTGILHAAIFGNWPELVIGEWGAVEIIVDPYSSKPTIVEVAAHVMADVMIRHVESFAASIDILVA